MNWLTSILLFLCLWSTGFSQSFDEFTLDKEVSVFAKNEFKDLKNFELGIDCPEEENQWYLDSLDYSPWYVGDFNGDEIPDLFLTGKENKQQTHYIIMGKDELDEEASFSLIPVYPPKVRGNLIVPFVEETRKGLLIIFRHFETSVRTETRNGVEVRVPRTYQDYYKLGLIKKDTLVYKFGGILEYNPQPEYRDIRFLQIHSYCQYGACPDFKMKIDSARNMILANIKNTEQDIGKYASFCDEVTFQKIFDLARYLKLPKSSQKFGEESADHVFTMIIMYQDNTSKTWYDYEQGATLAISQLYELMHQVKTNANWEYREADTE